MYGISTGSSPFAWTRSLSIAVVAVVDGASYPPAFTLPVVGSVYSGRAALDVPYVVVLYVEYVSIAWPDESPTMMCP